MTHFIKTIKLFTLLGAAAFCGVSCQKVLDHNRNICDYTVRLWYDYNRENTSADNIIGQYVSVIDEYIFDEDGVLLSVNRITRDVCDDTWHSDLDLPPGRYSVIAWGNATDINTVNDARPGITCREDMVLSPDHPFTRAAELQNNGDRLFYGYRSFSVEPSVVGRVRVDVVHSHFSLTFRIRWKNNSPDNTGEFHAALEEVASGYAFMPNFCCKGLTEGAHDPTDDAYPSVTTSPIHYIQAVTPDVHKPLCHRRAVELTVDKAIQDEFVTHRIRKDADLLLSLYKTDAGVRTQVMKDVNLKTFFDQWNINLDMSLRQEYALDFLIDGDRVTVSPVNITDWEEGGNLGGINI